MTGTFCVPALLIVPVLQFILFDFPTMNNSVVQHEAREKKINKSFFGSWSPSCVFQVTSNGVETGFNTSLAFNRLGDSPIGLFTFLLPAIATENNTRHYFWSCVTHHFSCTTLWYESTLCCHINAVLWCGHSQKKFLSVFRYLTLRVQRDKSQKSTKAYVVDFLWLPFTIPREMYFYIGLHSLGSLDNIFKLPEPSDISREPR